MDKHCTDIKFEFFIKNIKDFNANFAHTLGGCTHIFTDTEYYHNDVIIRCSSGDNDEICARFVYEVPKGQSLEPYVKKAKKELGL